MNTLHTTYLSSLLGVITEYNSNHTQKWGQLCWKSVQLDRVAFFWSDFLQNWYFSMTFKIQKLHILGKIKLPLGKKNSIRYMKFWLQPCFSSSYRNWANLNLPIQLLTQLGKIKTTLRTKPLFLKLGIWYFGSTPVIFCQAIKIPNHFKPCYQKCHNEVKSRYHYAPNLSFLTWVHDILAPAMLS